MLAAEILEAIKRDIATFADPGTPIEIGTTGAMTWTQSRKQRTAQLLRTPGGFPDVRVGDRELAYQ